MPSQFSLYLHFPYCLHKCPYCDFNTYAVSTFPEKDYVAALLSELDYRATLPEWKGRLVATIYFGGGTPSLLSPYSIRRVISHITRLFPVAELAEVSLEANPGTVSPDSLHALREAGVNRLSLGAQSFNSATLKTLGRIHSAAQTEAAVQGARGAGFTNISLDLMYGVPGQSFPDLVNDLRAALQLNPVHISAYGLTIEKGTPFYQSYKKGTLVLPKESTVVTMMEEINTALPARGFARYEISNFAKPGKQARHNLAYWNGDDYLGLGAGAHSFNASLGTPGGTRWSNFAQPNKYMDEAVTRGYAEGWRDTLTAKDAIFEFFFLGLRKIEGVSASAFAARFGQSIEATFPGLCAVLLEGKLIKENGDYIALSERGLMLADSVIENFSPDEVVFPAQLEAAAFNA